ncbi:MAG: hypothetical protein KI785_09655 [Devosiaceae bacterium]|nr:hypothetical protein [Devosiaceae bacterium MH13]
MTQALKSLVLRIVGWTLAVVGFVMFVLPIPLGIPVMATGLVILITTSRAARRMMRWMRMRVRFIDRSFSYLETRSPARLGAILRKTRYRRIGRRPLSGGASSS